MAAGLLMGTPRRPAVFPAGYLKGVRGALGAISAGLLMGTPRGPAVFPAGYLKGVRGALGAMPAGRA